MSILSCFDIGTSILMYHSVTDDLDEPYSVSIEAFREQLAWLANNGYEIIPLSRLLEMIQADDRKGFRKKVVLTFDDGYKDFVINALPLLIEYKATATVFFVTEMFGGVSSWNTQWDHVRLMTEDDARFVMKKGMNIGSHTASHDNLRVITPEKSVKREIVSSYHTIKNLGETFITLAYPFGKWCPEVVDAAQAVGYKCALVLGEYTNFSKDNIYHLPRITMLRDMDITSFEKQLIRTVGKKTLQKLCRTVRKKLRKLYCTDRQKSA
jgi:peptidoglycan/xylan/chitin deacetylase (PgdA/CDA1 family)